MRSLGQSHRPFSRKQVNFEMAAQIIPLAVAKEKLCEIDKNLTGPLLLIGGIAVNHYIKSRDSHDIDLICTQDQSYSILKTFPYDEWNISDGNDDPTRPAYVLSNKNDPRVIIKFGPKIVERGAYEYLNWDILFEDSLPLTHQNKPLTNIFIPNATFLAYSKLISFFLRSDRGKRDQDLLDFVNLSNCDSFSYAKFLSIIERLNARKLLIDRYDEFLEVYKRSGTKSLLMKVGELFPETLSKGKLVVLQRGSPELIPTILDAAIYFKDAPTFAVEEIRVAVQNKILLPSHLLYRTEEGAKSWLALCESPLYSFYLSSFNNFYAVISQVVELLHGKSQSADLDLISLGVGDGKKDRIFIEALIANVGRDLNLWYYPVDISLLMIGRTARQIANSQSIRSAKSNLNIKPIVGDFFGIHSIDQIYNYRTSPKIFSILGNTLGNGREFELFQTLRSAVQSGDFVLLEISTDQSGDLALSTTSENRKVDLAPLVAAGYAVAESDLQYKVIRGDDNVYSIVPDTVSIIAECDVLMERTELRTVRTSVVHHYQLEQFARKVGSQLGMAVLHKSEADGVGLVLLHKS
jgi:hypothetical protein